VPDLERRKVPAAEAAGTHSLLFIRIGQKKNLKLHLQLFLNRQQHII
jgi:hypothetical protein